jgi:excisionase family DNA binding protein
MSAVFISFARNRIEKEKLSALWNKGAPRAAPAGNDSSGPTLALLPLPPKAPAPVDAPRESVRRRYLLKARPDPFAKSPKLLTVGEVADILRVHRSTLYRMIHKSKMPGLFRVGADWRIDADRMWEYFTQPREPRP